MKKKWTILFLILLTLPLLYGSCATVGIEKPDYTVLQKEDAFEVRQYPEMLAAETLVDASFQEAGNIAFRRLFDYISGKNRSSESISMTAPVTQQSRSEKIAMTAPVTQETRDGKYAVSFVMPSEYTLQTLPEPADPQVVIRQIPEQKVAAVRYSGTWSRDRYDEKEAALKEFIREKNLTALGEPVFARYDPPFQLWFLRRNEVLIPVE